MCHRRHEHASRWIAQVKGKVQLDSRLSSHPLPEEDPTAGTAGSGSEADPQSPTPVTFSPSPSPSPSPQTSASNFAHGGPTPTNCGTGCTHSAGGGSPIHGGDSPSPSPSASSSRSPSVESLRSWQQQSVSPRRECESSRDAVRPEQPDHLATSAAAAVAAVDADPGQQLTYRSVIHHASTDMS